MGDVGYASGVPLIRTIALRATAIASLILAMSSSAGAEASAVSVADRAFQYLSSRQSSDGSFGSRADSTAEFMASLAAVDPSFHAVTRALDFIASEGPAGATEAAYAGRIASGLVTAGKDPHNFAGYNYIERIRSFYNPATGAYDTRIYADALAALGIIAARDPLPDQAITYLIANQCASGGFSHDAGCIQKADVDTTAIVICVLANSSSDSAKSSLGRARDFLLTAQNAEGGFGFATAGPTNANSTGLVLSAINALDEDPTRPPWRQSDGDDPLKALLPLQLPSGGFRYLSSDQRANDYATAQAIPGVLGIRYPLRPGPVPVPPGAQTHRAAAGARLGRTPASPAASPTAFPQTAGALALSPKSSPSAMRAGIVAIVIRDNVGMEQVLCTRQPVTTGLQALRAVANITTKDYGGVLGSAVCKINGWGEGTATCPGGRGHWHYWHQIDSRWIESSSGPSNYSLPSHAIEAWTWETKPQASRPRTADPAGRCSVVAAPPTRRTSDVKPVFAAGVALIMLVGLRTLLVRTR